MTGSEASGAVSSSWMGKRLIWVFLGISTCRLVIWGGGRRLGSCRRSSLRYVSLGRRRQAYNCVYAPDRQAVYSELDVRGRDRDQDQEDAEHEGPGGDAVGPP